MVQVDVFWAYGFGAGYAVAAHRQLKKEYDADPEKAQQEQWYSRPFVKSLLFISIFFAPSGIYLLWAFPDWETMQVAVDHSSLPAWLVTAFAATNVTQGILGYWLTRRFIVRGDSYKGFLSFLFSYIGFFFILVHGWDGTGYRRFFSASREQFLTWGARPWYDWLTSDVALTLYGMGVILLPVVLTQCAALAREGYRLLPEPERPRPAVMSAGTLIAMFLAAIFGCGLGSAIVASVLIHYLGWIGGTVAALAILYVGGVKGLFRFAHEAFVAGRMPTRLAGAPAASHAAS